MLYCFTDDVFEVHVAFGKMLVSTGQAQLQARMDLMSLVCGTLNLISFNVIIISNIAITMFFLELFYTINQ